MSRAQRDAMTLVDTRRSLPVLADRVRKAAERRLEARVSAADGLRGCRYCARSSVLVEVDTLFALCGEHAARSNRALVAVEAFMRTEP